MNKNDYIAQVDSIAFSPDLEQKLLDGAAQSKPKKKPFALPISLAACFLLVVTLIVIPSLKAKNGTITDAGAVKTEEYKNKTTLYSASTAENYLADTSQSYSEDILTAGCTAETEENGINLRLHRLVLTHKNGESLSKTEYEAECDRLCELGYEAGVWEIDGVPCIVIGINDAKDFTNTGYDFEITLITDTEKLIPDGMSQ